MIEDDDPRNDFVPGEWEALAALPNLSLSGWIDFDAIALIGGEHPLLPSVLAQEPDVVEFFTIFTDEFGAPIYPSVMLVRKTAPKIARGIDALTSFTSAVCAAAIVDFRCGRIVHNQPFGVAYSEAFDLYPWFPARGHQGHVSSWTPAGGGFHELAKLRPQSGPGVRANRLERSLVDQVLIDALRSCWIRAFVKGESTEHLSLFRSLEMARAASRAPGGVDATIHDIGRIVALWVSAFEILIHDGRADKKRVHEFLMRCSWLHRELQKLDRHIMFRRDDRTKTNLAGGLLDALYRTRNDFLHGNPVTDKSMRFESSERSIDAFGAPIYRLLLGSALSLDHDEGVPEGAGVDDFAEAVCRACDRRNSQRLAERAILAAVQSQGHDRDVGEQT